MDNNTVDKLYSSFKEQWTDKLKKNNEFCDFSDDPE